MGGVADAPAQRRIVVIIGPTAGGKSDLAAAVGAAMGGEVIGADSMQVYRGLEAGTAKPSAAQRAAAPHHLIDIVEPTEPFTVADWLVRAERLIAELHGRRKLPIIVGGSNLYIRALLEGMFEGPPADEPFRETLAPVDSAELHERLRRVDPEAAQRIDPHDRKRIVRALEVRHLTGRPISELQRQWDERAERPYRHDPILIGLRWGVEPINRRINARVKAMFDPPPGREGLVAETRRLLGAGKLGPQAREAIGAKQVIEHLRGRCSEAEAMERVKIETRRFAKNQRTWLKRFRGVHWLDAERLGPEGLAERAVEIIRRELALSGGRADASARR